MNSKVRHCDGFYERKAKYIVVLTTTLKGVWVEKFFNEHGVVPSMSELWSYILQQY